ncbi:hypothetical protein D8Y22_21570 [Salinadaptatus halalkaliphilus]|uniref:Metal-dependent hydrolase n=1 Tax=Salinadaptatus halalkaliphilus TaxID=2419781 RepID=A0A4S3TIJ1_9EURY|nr:hypothetical protein [Salinadaptatus halalkaliphilus]THE63033.1 hypothetical protein D8Y22_21570 [Salinadaptatus halalkaliphilus]
MTAGLVVVLPPVSVSGVAVPTIGVLVFGTALGVLVDLDHFVIARFKTGSWDAAQFCLGHPTAVFTDQGRIFDPGDVGVLSRLLSHLLVTGVLVSIVALSSVPLAVIVAGVLYAHICADIVWDIWRVDSHANGAADTGELARAFR